MQFCKGAAAIISLLSILLAAPFAYGKILTRDQALQSAFPRSQIESIMIFLTDQELQEASKLSGEKIESPLVARFIANVNSQQVGRAYLDTNTVRTKKQSLLVMLNPEGTIKRVEVVTFLEPPEYMATDRWYQQFEGKSLTDDLRINRSLHPITGATLTARATTDAVRRVLAIDQILGKRQDKKP